MPNKIAENVCLNDEQFNEMFDTGKGMYEFVRNNHHAFVPKKQINCTSNITRYYVDAREINFVTL